MSSEEASRSRWSWGIELLTRPYPLRPRVVVPIVALMVIFPFYLAIAEVTRAGNLHLPELALDRLVPLQPAWSLIYASHLAFVYMPVLVMRDEEQIRRTFLAYLLVWSVGFGCFLAYPTVLPRPADTEIGNGFFAWCLRMVYSADPPRNNFPSLHVAHACVSALTCLRLSRGVGITAAIWAALIALSTLFTKQHYVADVIAGFFLAGVGYLVFLRNCPRVRLTELDRRGAPTLVLGLIGLHLLVVAGFWIAYAIR